MSSDPLLQPYRLKHLTLKQPADDHQPRAGLSEDGMPKERYRAYHVERARAGIAHDDDGRLGFRRPRQPAGLQQLLAWKDEVVGWMQAARRRVHEHDCAVMIQLTHLGRRTRWDKADWLPVVSPATSARPRTALSRRRPRTGTSPGSSSDYAAAAERMQAAGPRWHRAPGLRSPDRPVLVPADQRPRRPLWRQPRQPPALHLRDAEGDPRPRRRRLHRRHPLHRRRGPSGRPDQGGRPGDLPPPQGLGMVDFLNVVKGHIDTDAGLTDVIPVQGMRPPRISTSPARSAPPPDSRPSTPPKIADVATARHAIAIGKLDMVGMTRAHMADPHIVAKILARRGGRSAPASAPTTASTASTRAAWPSACTIPRPAAS